MKQEKTTIINPFVDVKNEQQIIDNPKSPDKTNLRVDSIIIGGVDGSLGLKINREGMWFGSKKFTDATLGIDMSGAITTGVSSYIHPITSADTLAPVNSIYFSSTQNCLVYKDSSGVVYDIAGIGTERLLYD